jgi:hypothetical protein
MQLNVLNMHAILAFYSLPISGRLHPDIAYFRSHFSKMKEDEGAKEAKTSNKREADLALLNQPLHTWPLSWFTLNIGLGTLNENRLSGKE